MIYDASAIPSRGLIDLVVDTAKKLKLPLQFETVERGGTDAGRIHVTSQGVPSISIGVAARYMAWTRKPGEFVFPYECDSSYGK